MGYLTFTLPAEFLCPARRKSHHGPAYSENGSTDLNARIVNVLPLVLVGDDGSANFNLRFFSSSTAINKASFYARY